MKLSEKFARQETEEKRLARIARRRIRRERAESIHQFLGISKPLSKADSRRAIERTEVCEVCGRGFFLPMHLGRHKKSKHTAEVA